MILRKTTTAYLLILTSLTLIPVSVYLTNPTAHAMIPFTSYQDLREFIHANGCSSSPLCSTIGALLLPAQQHQSSAPIRTVLQAKVPPILKRISKCLALMNSTVSRTTASTSIQ